MKKLFFRFFVYGAFILLFSASIQAQSFEPFIPYGDLIPSANSWSMIKYGGITPSLYTGAMSWTIPLFTYSDPDFNIPVSLDYNYDGFRPAAHSGEIGLGWALNCGGVITREVRGVPDEQDASTFEPGYFATNLTGYYHTVRNSYLMTHREEGYLSYTDWSVKNNRLRCDLDPEALIINQPEDLLSTENGGLFDPFMDQPGFGGTYETTPDLFHFSVMGLTGDFCIAPDTTVQVFNTNVPFGSLNIDIYDVGKPDYVHQQMTIKITDNKGFQFIFGGSIATTEYAESASGDSFDQHYNWGETLIITALKLSRVIAPNGRTAVFNYSPYTQCNFARLLSRRSVLFQYNYTSIDGFHQGQRNIPSTPLQCVQMQYYSPLESVIIDNTAVLSFGYTLRSFDENSNEYYGNVWIPDCFSFVNSFSCRAAVRLSSFSVHNSNNEPVESISFSHSHATTGTPKLFLDSLSIRSQGTYAFSYTYRDHLPNNDVSATDYWGYWNQRGFLYKTDINYNSTSLYNQFIASTIKTPSYLHTVAGALKRITYPTGGYTDVEYESNSADKLIETSLYDAPHLIINTTNFPVGGLRVKSLTDVTETSRDTTCFEYSNGTLLQMPRYYTPLHFDYFNNDLGTIHLDLAKFFVGYPTNSPRSNYITYGSVKTNFPDHSFVETYFHDYQTHPDRYYSVSVDTIRAFDKNIYCERHTVTNMDCSLVHDEFWWHGYPSSWTVSGFNNVVVENLSPIRGRISKVLTYSAEGLLKKKEEYYYNIVSVYKTDWLWFNDISRFYAIRRKCYSSMPSETHTTIYENGTGLLTREIEGYNDKGQLTYRGCVDSQGTIDAIYLRYNHTAGRNNPSGLENLLSDAIKTHTSGNQTWIIAAESYYYGLHGCPFPTKIITKVFDIPHNVSMLSVRDYFSVTADYIRTSVFSYNTKHRLINVSMPGGATITYTWDALGNHLTSKAINGTLNKTLFEWKDLIGLSKLTTPTGAFETYEYDNRYRLRQIKDSNRNTVFLFDYNMAHEDEE